jgi:guanylate kinase
MVDLKRRGFMLVLSSPSGAGKSSIARQLMDDKGLELSISVTTRERRTSEIDGIHYHFIDKKTFQRMRDGDDLLEWAEVHGNLYGTPAAPVEEALASGKDVLFDIDWQGAAQIAKARRQDVVLVFVLAPTIAELRSRLIRRAEDDPDVIQRRLRNARDEIGHWAEYDYVVINQDLSTSFNAVRSILVAERHKRVRQLGLPDFVTALQAEQ